MNNKKAKPEKTNPHGCTGEPWISRSFAAVEWRCLVRAVIAGLRGPQALEEMLGSFAPSPVRGDFVPTIAESYAQALHILNSSELRRVDEATQHLGDVALTPQLQTILTPDGRFRLEVRFTPATPNKKQKANT